ncbi:MAG: DUF3365 domain-containing protein [Deltaproteobacteria bacterium]|nr:DUF3365 domain-containing protein [Deltaproteobacteria bacterium]
MNKQAICISIAVMLPGVVSCKRESAAPSSKQQAASAAPASPASHRPASQPALKPARPAETGPQLDDNQRLAARLRILATLNPLKKQLVGQLTSALQAGTPASAVAACKLVVAKQRVKGVKDHAVKVGRTTDKLRNPLNRSPKWVEPYLAHFAVGVARPLDNFIVSIDDKQIGYIEPIYVKPMCTVCHGSEVDETTKAKLAELYPQDNAQGYKDGAFRGVFWATLERSALDAKPSAASDN